MNRSGLIIQSDKHTLIELSRIFKQRGDEIHTSPSSLPLAGLEAPEI